MTRKSTAFGAALLALLFVLASPLVPAREPDPSHLAGVIETGMEMWRVPGMAVAVIDDGDVVMQRGFGVASRGGRKVDEHTLFANASTTKAMVAAGLLLLVDEGKLRLDDPVIEHLPELHFNGQELTQQLTIIDLLAHRTGLPSTDYWTFLQLTPLEEQMTRLRLVSPEAAPRERLIYQNTMYELAGLIIERVSGQRWDRFLEERLWRPIGMNETYGTRGAIPDTALHVQPHEIVDGEVTEIGWDLPADLADAAGSAWTSVHDMTLWAKFLLAGGVTRDGRRLLSEEAVQAMFEPRQLATPDDFYPTVELTKPRWRTYALGWFQQDFGGKRIDFHTGSLDGLIAIIGLDRDHDRAVIVMGNLDHAEMRHAVLWEVMDDTAGAARRDWNRDVYALYEERRAEADRQWAKVEKGRLAGTSPSLDPSAYEGVYRNPIVGDIRIERRGEAYLLRTGMYDYELSHWHLDTFLVTYPTWRHGNFAEFAIDPDGSVASLELFGQLFRPAAGDEPG